MITPLGIVVVLIPLALVAWGVRRVIRSRGGQAGVFCRRCMYDLAGVDDLTCPECGQTHGSIAVTRRRNRPRARLGWAGVATGGVVLVLIIGTLLPQGYWSFVPTPVLRGAIGTPLHGIGARGIDRKLGTTAAYTASNVVSVIDYPASFTNQRTPTQWDAMARDAMDLLRSSRPMEIGPARFGAELITRAERYDDARVWAIDWVGRITPIDSVADTVIEDALQRVGEDDEARAVLCVAANRWRHRTVLPFTPTPAWHDEVVAIANGERADLGTAARADALTVLIGGRWQDHKLILEILGDCSPDQLPEVMWQAVLDSAMAHEWRADVNAPVISALAKREFGFDGAAPTQAVPKGPELALTPQRRVQLAWAWAELRCRTSVSRIYGGTSAGNDSSAYQRFFRSSDALPERIERLASHPTVVRLIRDDGWAGKQLAKAIEQMREDVEAARRVESQRP